MDVTIPFSLPYAMILALIGGVCVCANSTLIKSFSRWPCFIFIALCSLHFLLVFFSTRFHELTSSVLGLPRIPTAGPLDVSNKQHASPHTFSIEMLWLCGCHCSVRFRCVIQMISLHRFHLFCNPTCFFVLHFLRSPIRMDVAEQDLSLYAEEVLTGKLIFSLIRWEYFVCVCVLPGRFCFCVFYADAVL